MAEPLNMKLMFREQKLERKDHTEMIKYTSSKLKKSDLTKSMYNLITNKDSVNKGLLTGAIKVGSKMRRLGLPGGKAVIGGASKVMRMTPVARGVLGGAAAGAGTVGAMAATKKKKQAVDYSKATRIEDINKGIASIAGRLGRLNRGAAKLINIGGKKYLFDNAIEAAREVAPHIKRLGASALKNKRLQGAAMATGALLPAAYLMHHGKKKLNNAMFGGQFVPDISRESAPAMTTVRLKPTEKLVSRRGRPYNPTTRPKTRIGLEWQPTNKAIDLGDINKGIANIASRMLAGAGKYSDKYIGAPAGRLVERGARGLGSKLTSAGHRAQHNYLARSGMKVLDNPKYARMGNVANMGSRIAGAAPRAGAAARRYAPAAMGAAGAMGLGATYAIRRRMKNNTNKATNIGDIEKGVGDIARRMAQSRMGRGMSRGVEAGFKGIGRGFDVVDRGIQRAANAYVKPFERYIGAPVERGVTRGIDALGRSVRDLGYRGQGRLMGRRGLTGIGDPKFARMGQVADVGRGISRNAPGVGGGVGRAAGGLVAISPFVALDVAARNKMRNMRDRNNR